MLTNGSVISRRTVIRMQVPPDPVFKPKNASAFLQSLSTKTVEEVERWE